MDLTTNDDEVKLLLKRAKRTLELYGSEDMESPLWPDVLRIFHWEGNGIAVSREESEDGSCLEIRLTSKDILRSVTVYEEVDGGQIYVDHSLVGLANDLLAKHVVLDDLADS